MTSKMWYQIAVCALLTLSCPTTAWSASEIFSSYSLDQAKQLAQKDGKLLLVDFTAVWCPSCKKMESTTWTDGAVQAWIKENAIAVQVDVDKDERTASSLKIEAMPTLVLFTPQSGAAEFTRQVGAMDSAELIQWLDGAKSGKSVAELEREQAAGNEVWDHLGKAREAQAGGRSAEVLDEYVWLWSHVRKGDPNLADLQTGLLPYEMKQLAATFPAAKIKFAEMRDAAEKADARADWIILNGVLDDNARTLAWFDKAKADVKQRETFKKCSALLEPVLFSKSRWADAAAFLYPEPLVKINEIHKRAQDMLRPRPHTEIAKDFDPFPSMVLLVYGAYIGAGRDAEAQKIADECLRLDNVQGMRDALSNMANGMRQARAAVRKGK